MEKREREAHPGGLASLCRRLLFEEAGFCLSCGERGRALTGGLCPTCQAALDWTSSRRKLSGDPDLWVFSAAFYNNFLQKEFTDYKFSGKSYKEEIFTAILSDYLANHPLLSQVRWIAYLPMRRRRATLRAYNPALNFARALARRRGMVLIHALEKVRESKEQHTLSGRDRLDNVQASYALAERAGFFSAHYWREGRLREGQVALEDLQGEAGILLDDLVTTGRTMLEGAHPLLQRGIGVYGLTLASASYPTEEQKEEIP